MSRLRNLLLINEQPHGFGAGAPVPTSGVSGEGGEAGGGSAAVAGGSGAAGTPPTDMLIGVDMNDFEDPSTIVECQNFECFCRGLRGTYRGVNYCTLPSGQFLRKAIRKEYRTLTDDERARLHNAVNRLKSSKVYDHFHALHYHYSYGSGIHGGPAFALWHREFIKRYEFALRLIDPTIAIPYWDMTIDQILPDPKDSIMWTADFMGSVDSNGYLNSGPFASWVTLEVTNKANYSDKQIQERTVPIQKLGKKRIMRKLGSDFGNTLIADINITRIMTNSSIYLIFGDGQVGVENCSSLNWLGSEGGTLWIEKTLENIHGMVHQFVGGMGGDMGEFQTSVGDPVFFLLHGFVDLLFEMWRQLHQSRYERENTYREPNSRCHISEHYLDTNMRPFMFQGAYIKNKDGLSNNYTDQFYEYESRPSCNVKNCSSKYLFCDNSKNQRHCGVKIKVGGNCSGLLDSDGPCYNGWCRNLDGT
uniref:Tyrosinase copper-binding domain-containing protein n=1 Tax=Acrobeloides nanus TaxID=290746 RepID=A0A914CPE1_9BILA